MGVYCYSIRAKTVAITLPDGSKVKANLYSYAYKLSSYWKGDRGYNSYQFMVNNTERNADQVFAKPRSGYVILGDPERDLAVALTNSGKPLFFPEVYFLLDIMRQITRACPKVAPRRRPRRAIRAKAGPRMVAAVRERGRPARSAARPLRRTHSA